MFDFLRNLYLIIIALIAFISSITINQLSSQQSNNILLSSAGLLHNDGDDDIQACPIQIPSLPDQVSINAHPNMVQNSNCRRKAIDWNSIDNASHSDDDYAEVVLKGKNQSDCIYFSDFQLNIPLGASIEGIELWIEGHVEGDEINELKIQLTNENGMPMSANKAKTSGKMAWTKGTLEEDTFWNYGNRSDNWGIDWTSEIINSTNFGVSIRLNQTKDSTHSVIRIDQVRLKVYYTPLPKLCHDSCNIFLVDPISEVIAYLWDLPVGAFINSADPYKNTITVNVDNLSEGIHEICVRSLTMTSISDPCCMKFVKGNCTPSSIGNYVWLDKNIDGIQDTGEIGLADIPVQLFDATTQKLLKDTLTDSLGHYQFDNMDEGHYFIEFTPPTDYVASIRFGSNKNIDNDVSEVNGRFITNPFYLGAGVDKLDIDAGFNASVIVPGSIGNYVWQDRDEDGKQDNWENGINGVPIILYDDNHKFVAARITQNDSLFRPGYYVFDSIAPGKYYIVVLKSRDYRFSKAHATANKEKDSDITENINPGSSDIFKLKSGEINFSIDVGLTMVSTLGDYIWEDTNNDGIQDSTESGMNGITVHLFDDQANHMYSTITRYDSTLNRDGYYMFEDLLAGGYYIQVDLPKDYEVSTSDVGGNDALDNDINNSNGLGSTFIFYLSPGEHERDIDGGIYKTSSLGSLVWVDQNTNGMKDDNEMGISDVGVSIFDVNGLELDYTYSDDNGQYEMNNLPQGNYYLKFDAPDGFDFTMSMPDHPDENSDVNHEFGYGTTHAIQIGTNQQLMHIDAGLQENTILALHFLDFNLTALENGINLKWKVDNVEDVEYFIIMRKRNDEVKYTPINEYKLDNVRGLDIIYNFLDVEASKGLKYSYYIKSVSLDGSNQRSKAKSLYSTSVRQNELVCYPNPASDFISLQLPINVKDNVEIKIKNLLGTLIYSQNVAMHHKDRYIQLNVSDLATGSYILELNSNGYNESTKLMIQR